MTFGFKMKTYPYGAGLVVTVMLCAVGCNKSRDPVPVRRPDLNVRVSVDYSINRGEDPKPCYELLRSRMRAATFDYYMFSGPSELGSVCVEVEDDNLGETLKIFRDVLADTKSPYEPFIKAR